MNDNLFIKTMCKYMFFLTVSVGLSYLKTLQEDMGIIKRERNKKERIFQASALACRLQVSWRLHRWKADVLNQLSERERESRQHSTNYNCMLCVLNATAYLNLVPAIHCLIRTGYLGGKCWRIPGQNSC